MRPEPHPLSTEPCASARLWQLLWITQQRPPPPSPTPAPATPTPAAPRPLSQGASAPGDHPDFPFSLCPQGPHLPASRVLEPLSHSRCTLTGILPNTMGARRERAAGARPVSPPCRQSGSAATPSPREEAPAASSSSTGRQVQLGPRWPDSCRSRPPLPPRVSHWISTCQPLNQHLSAA